MEKRCWETKKKVLGEEHADTLMNMANLASTYNYQKRWSEAEDLNVRVMDTRKKVLGEKHPDTLTSMENLIVTYRKQKRIDEAKKLETSAKELRTRRQHKRMKLT